MSRALGGPSPSALSRYVNGAILDPTESEEATTGLLQAGATADDDDDAPMATAAVVQTTTTASGGRLEASGTEVSLHGRPAATGLTSAARTSSTASIRSAWKLKYQDFLPDRKHGRFAKWNPSSSEHFQKLVDHANDWLDKNRDVQVKTCQTMTWMSHDSSRLGSGEFMISSKNFSENAVTYYLRGLRLWLVPRTQSHRQQPISVTDFIPDGKNDNIQSLVAKINKKIEHKQLKGQILMVETFGVPNLHGRLDGRITRWSESINDDIPYAFGIRVFHCRSLDIATRHFNEHAHIGVKDMVPLATDDGYEGFEEMIERTNTWLKDQSDILVVNMQSVMVQKDDDGPHSETGNACHYVEAGINSPKQVDFFRILRLAYRKSPVQDANGCAAADLDFPVIYPFTYETFTPELVRVGTGSAQGASVGGPASSRLGNQKERLETMNETFSKVIAFLQNSGADVICAEMVANPMQLYTEDGGQSLAGPDEIQFLLTIRLFLTGQISRFDGTVASIKRASIISGRGGRGQSPMGRGGRGRRSGDDDDDSRPGPIFLRSVVTRQFKYRWLVLAISVFFSMAVIVALSVVYSNR